MAPTPLFPAGLKEISPLLDQKTPLAPIKSQLLSSTASDPEYRLEIVWKNVIYFTYLHCVVLYGSYLIITFNVNIFSFVFYASMPMFTGLGITAGAHRLWAHKSYKAKAPLRLFLAFWQTIALQNHIYEWVRDHRVHHKFTDTNADPHNSRRGFFFSHIGWLMVRKHQDVFVRGKTVDMSDLEKDWVVVWQRKLYSVLILLCCVVLPVSVPMYFWGESIWMAWNLNVMRYAVSLNITWLVNSAAHIWGMKPYNKHNSPTQNASVAFLALGEGWHNYHHVFPWDYKAAELGQYFNYTTCFLDICAWLGLAYDLKTVPDELVCKMALRLGDGTHSVYRDHSQHGKVWDWEDKDIDEKENELEIIQGRKL